MNQVPMARTNKLRAKIRRLEEKCRCLKEENRRLKLELQEYRQKTFKKNLSPSAAGKDHLIPKKRGAPVGHPGTTRKKPEEIHHLVEVTLQQCPCCGSRDLTPCDRTEDHIQEDIVLPKVEATCFHHSFYYCKSCGEVVSGTGPGELPGSYIGPVAKSVSSFLHHQMRVPYRKMRTLFSELFGLDFVPSSAPGFDNQIRYRGVPLYEKMKADLPKQPFLHVDETGWRKEGINHWLWCFASSKAVVYCIDPSRGAKVITSILGKKYSGVLISDFLAAYNLIKARKQRCLVHLLRLIKKWETYFRDQTKKLSFFSQLKKIVKQIIEWSRTLQTEKVPTAIDRSAELIARLRKMLNTTLGHLRADKFLAKLRKHFDELITCLEIKGVCSHNNRVERLLRDNVILRKITFGNRSNNGTRNHEVLMSILQTAQSKKLNPLKFFHLLLTNPDAASNALLDDSS